MTCEEARELLWPPEEPRLAEGRVLMARRHVEECESCRDYLAQDALLLEAFRKARRIQAPPEVRERVFDALARERLGSEPSEEARTRRGPRFFPLSRSTVFAICASAALLVVALFAWGDGRLEAPLSAGPDAGSAFVEDFLRRAVQAEHIETSDPAEVARFLSRELGVAVGSPVEFAGFELEGAEVCIVEGLRGAVVIYKQNGKVLYHYLIPRSDGDETSPAPSDVVPPDWAGEALYPSVVTWRSENLDQALVSDIAPEELMEVARSLVVGP